MNQSNVKSKEYADEPAIKNFQTYFEQAGFAIFDYGRVEPTLQGLYQVPHEIGYKMIISYCNALGNLSLAKKCVIEYVEHSQFQAYAAKDKDFYYIGISAALPALLQAMFQNLFAFTNPLTDLAFEEEGDTVEKTDDEDVFYIFPDRLMTGKFNSDELLAEITALIKDTIPHERWQRVMSVKMAEMAIAFCIAHEIGHLLNGHVDILDKRSLACMAEISSGLRSKERNIPGPWLSQVWEIQADKAGMAMLYSYVINTRKNFDRFMHYLKCKNKIDLYGRLMYAVYMVFLLIGQQQHVVRAVGTHPAAVTRVSYLMAFLGTLMVDRDKYDPEFSGGIVEQYAEMAEAAWKRIGFSTGRYEEAIDDLTTVVQDLQRADRSVMHTFRNSQWAVRHRK